MTFIEWLKSLFHTPSADVLALQELEEARRELLMAQTGLEYARAIVEYNSNRVVRLQQRTEK